MPSISERAGSLTVAPGALVESLLPVGRPTGQNGRRGKARENEEMTSKVKGRKKKNKKKTTLSLS
jgi:hypothetical protein